MAERNALIAVAAFFVVAIVLVSMLGYLYVQKKQNEEIVLYYGYSCPHCKVVEQFINDNNLTARFDIIQREVMNNTGNYIEFQGVAKTCRIPLNNLMVPVIASDGRCYQGQDESIAFLQARMNSG